MPGKKIDKATGKPVLLDTKVTNVRNYTSPFWRSALAYPELSERILAYLAEHGTD